MNVFIGIISILVFYSYFTFSKGKELGKLALRSLSLGTLFMFTIAGAIFKNYKGMYLLSEEINSTLYILAFVVLTLDTIDSYASISESAENRRKIDDLNERIKNLEKKK